MSEAASRAFAWFPLGTAILAGAFALFYFVYLETGSYAINFGVGALASAAIIAPGLVISGIVNHVLLNRRPRPPRISVTERVLFGAQALLLLVLIWQAFDQWSIAAIPLAVLILAVAIATTVLLDRKSKIAELTAAVKEKLEAS